MKVTLSEIKENLQETNSGGDEAKNQINDLECKKEKDIQNRIQKNYNRLRSSLGHLQTFQHPNHRGARRRIRTIN